MAKIGRTNILKVVKRLDFGVYLDGGNDGEILLPTRYVPEDCQPGDRLEVFVYFDSEDRIIATTEQPLVQVGQCAYLRVVSVGGAGAFLDWGLPKDLLVPFREQNGRMHEGEKHLVHVYEDTMTRRVAASARLNKFLDKTNPDFEPGDAVQLLIGPETDLGFKAIVNHAFWGVLYGNEIFKPIATGQQMTGYVKQVREDLKIDLVLQPLGHEKVGGVAEQILERLKQAGGYLAMTDKSPADDIYQTFGVSKKTYKKAVGDLYRRRLVLLEPEGIRLVIED